MSGSSSDLILIATQKLKLDDIVLFDSVFVRGDDEGEGDSLFQQHKHEVEYSVENEEDSKVLLVKVTLGTRALSGSDEDAEVMLTVEASYMVVYKILDDLSDDCLKAFSQFNVVHNVWPFWRQHVFDIIDRGRLPQLEVPLFSGMKL